MIVPESVQPDTVTVYDEPLPDTANEQSVAVPAFMKSPGTTPVTLSENVSVYSIDAELVGDDSVEANPVTVGAVVSRVIVSVAVAADAGPVLPAASVPPSAANCGMIVPAEQPDTVTVYDEPLPDTANEQPVAVPVLLKSPVATPVTTFENEIVYSIDEALVGVVCADVNPMTVGAVVSRVIVSVAVAADAGPVLPAVSVPPSAANCGMIVPAEQPDTVTVYEVPEPDTANEQPVAVPVLEKSPNVTPLTDLENVMVYSIDDAFVGVDCVEVNPVTPGTEVSRVIVSVAVAADAGPVLPAASVAPFAVNTGVMVPDEQPDTSTVRVVPESDPGANEQPDADPALEKSPASTPVTLSENVSVYEMVAELVGVAAEELNPVTVGAVVSRVTIVVASASDVGPALPAASVALPDSKLGMIVPSEQPDTVTV